MRPVFYLVLSVVVLRMFFPEMTFKLEGVLSTFLDLAQAVFAQATAMTAA